MSQEREWTQESLAEVRDNTLPENYEPHDVGEARVIRRFRERGFLTVECGLDDRHGEVKFSDKPDLAIYTRDRVQTMLSESYVSTRPDGYVDVKTKRVSNDGHQWYGWVNERHHDKYVETARDDGVPVFVYMAVVDGDRNAVIRSGFYDVQTASVVNVAELKGNSTIKYDNDDERNISFVCDELRT